MVYYEPSAISQQVGGPEAVTHYLQLMHRHHLSTFFTLLGPDDVGAQRGELTGRAFTGLEAAERGIASRALPAADVLPAALELARDVAVNANPASVAYSKRLLWADLDPDAVAAEETTVHLKLMGGPDAAEGPAAWREHRPPRWRSKAGEAGDPA